MQSKLEQKPLKQQQPTTKSTIMLTTMFSLQTPCPSCRPFGQTGTLTTTTNPLLLPLFAEAKGPNDPGPALPPCQADSSVCSVPPVGARSCGTDEKQNSRQTCKNRSTDTESRPLLGGQDTSPLTVQGHWKKDNGGYQAHHDLLRRLKRAQQTAISRLRTGHCGLGAHLKRIGISDSIPDHVLWSCQKYADRRQLTWPYGADLVTKLWGSAEDLYRTAGFVKSTGLKI